MSTLAAAVFDSKSSNRDDGPEWEQLPPYNPAVRSTIRGDVSPENTSGNGLAARFETISNRSGLSASPSNSSPPFSSPPSPPSTTPSREATRTSEHLNKAQNTCPSRALAALLDPQTVQFVDYTFSRQNHHDSGLYNLRIRVGSYGSCALIALATKADDWGSEGTSKSNYESALVLPYRWETKSGNFGLDRDILLETINGQLVSPLIADYQRYSKPKSQDNGLTGLVPPKRAEALNSEALNSNAEGNTSHFQDGRDERADDGNRTPPVRRAA